MVNSKKLVTLIRKLVKTEVKKAVDEYLASKFVESMAPQKKSGFSLTQIQQKGLTMNYTVRPFCVFFTLYLKNEKTISLNTFII